MGIWLTGTLGRAWVGAWVRAWMHGVVDEGNRANLLGAFVLSTLILALWQNILALSILYFWHSRFGARTEALLYAPKMVSQIFVITIS